MQKRKSQFLNVVLLFAILLGRAANAAEATSTPPYKNASLPIEQRLDDLLGCMTLEEKVQQLQGRWEGATVAATEGVFDPAKASKEIGSGIGEFGPIRWELTQEMTLRNEVQKFLIEKTRLGIPAIFHEEGCHGLLSLQATSFPVPIGLASSWDTELTERIYTVVAGEMRARGIQHALTPVIDVCREPRWGRTDEMLGEDPYLNGKLGTAMVRGLQGSSNGTIAPGHVAATLKHLTGHGQPQSGINTGSADLGPREIHDIHLLPFRMVIADAKPAVVMPSYNEIDGIPSHANRWLLQDVLRKDFQFEGLVASDYSGIKNLTEVHHQGKDLADAAALAMTAGVDMDLPDGRSFSHLQAAVKQGKIPASLIDASVKRVLRLKFSLGLFENPYCDPQQAKDRIHRPESRNLALEAAQKSIVLLKNQNAILPLPRDKYRAIAVIGPNADQARLGSYSGVPLHQVTLLDGIRKKLGDSVKVLHAQGCKITTDLPANSMDAWLGYDAPKFPTQEENQSDIAAAVKVAGQADLVILALGENEAIAREAFYAGHKGDRANLELFGAQNELAQAIFRLGKPVVVYLMNGKPLAIPEIAAKADAIVEGWYMGQETGTAAADVLFGDVNPSGKLTMTFPRSTGQLPVYYNRKPGSRTLDYVDETSQPLFPFGFGLSYTTFVYSAPKLSSPTMPADGNTTASVTVTNTGKVAGDEIVQLYIRDRISSVTRPIKELKGFQRVSLKPGEGREVTFLINRKALTFHGIDLKPIVEPGEFEVMVGPSSAKFKSAVLTYVKAP